MKIRKNKKSYNFTAKQKRNDTHRLNCYHFHTVGKEWKVWASKNFRRTNKRLLIQGLKSGEEVTFVMYKKYMWWDM